MGAVKFYLSGSMMDSTWEEQSKWRQKIIDAISYQYEHNKRAIFFNPINYYNFEEKRYNSQREIMEFDLYNLRNSDVVIVNFNNEKSIGTAMELMLAKENKIPVIAFGVNGKEVHPWLLECCTRVCDSLREVVEYAVDFFLN